MANVLVVGGAGYLGGYLVDASILGGHDLEIFNKLICEDAYLKDVNFVYGNINNRAELKPHID